MLHTGVILNHQHISRTCQGWCINMERGLTRIFYNHMLGYYLVLSLPKGITPKSGLVITLLNRSQGDRRTHHPVSVECMNRSIISSASMKTSINNNDGLTLA